MPTPVTRCAIQDHWPSRPRYGVENSERLLDVTAGRGYHRDNPGPDPNRAAAEPRDETEMGSLTESRGRDRVWARRRPDGGNG